MNQQADLYHLGYVKSYQKMMEERDWKLLVKKSLKKKVTGVHLLYHYNLGGKKIQSFNFPQIIREISTIESSNNKEQHRISIDLLGNNIETVGCEQFSKVKWTNLQNLNLSGNNIGDMGCEHLSKVQWNNLQQLSLQINDISYVGCKYLSKVKWDNLQQLSLYSNSIGAVGCEYLSKAKWDNLQQLNLDQNNIVPVGCLHLSKAKWNNLQDLSLGNNYLIEEDNPIGRKSYQFLSKRFRNIKCDQKYRE